MQWQFLYRWLYGIVEPLSGEHFMLEFSHLDSWCFEGVLQAFAQMHPEELHLIQVYNAKAHSAQTLTVPDNVILLFQPPYCPELNPIERVWQELKRGLQWRHFDSISDLQESLSRWVPRLTPQQMQSLTQWGWLVDGLCVAGI